MLSKRRRAEMNVSVHVDSLCAFYLTTGRSLSSVLNVREGLSHLSPWDFTLPGGVGGIRGSEAQLPTTVNEKHKASIV